MSNAPAGWYQDPHGKGQRYWDGTTWTDQSRGPKGWYRERPNEHAVGLAVLFGVISYIGLLAVLNPRLGGTSAYGAGQLLVPAAVVTTVVALVARGSTHYLPWWVYSLAVPMGAGLLAILMTLGDLRESKEVADSRGERTGVLSTPGTGQGWTVFDTAETRAEVRRVTEGMASRGDFDSVVAEFYTHTSAPDSPVLFVGLNGELDEDRKAEEVVKELLAGASVNDPTYFDAGKTGGALGCGQGKVAELHWVGCAWIGNERAVLARWNDTGIGLERAAELTRDLRERSLR